VFLWRTRRLLQSGSLVGKEWAGALGRGNLCGCSLLHRLENSQSMKAHGHLEMPWL
jgi:hypothetical protein